MRALLPLLCLLAVPTVAQAEIPLPSYEARLGTRAWHAVDRHFERGVSLRADAAARRDPALRRELEAEADAAFRKAIEEATAYRQTVRDTSGLAYLEGLSWRMLDEPTKAEAAYRRSIELDPEGATDAWHDLGELLMTQEEWAEADAAFAHVTAQITDGPHAWQGPLRQAEVAAWQGDAAGLEKHLHEALRRGFKMDTIRGQPQWSSFYGDPRLHDTVEKMVRVYGDPSLLPALGPGPEPTPR